MALGCGDDDGTMDEDWAAWRAQLWERLVAEYKLTVSVGAASFAPTFRCVVTPSSGAEGKDEAAAAAATGATDPAVLRRRIQAFDMSKHSVIEVPIAESRELRNLGGASSSSEGANLADGSTLHIELDMSAAKLLGAYKTADNLGIHPRNAPKLVARCAKRLGVHPAATLTLERANASGAREPGARKMPCPSPCAVRDALAWHVDLGAAPKPAMLEVLAAFAADEKVRARICRYALTSF